MSAVPEPIDVVRSFMAAMERLDRHQLAKGWVELPVTGVWEVRDGRITVWRDYFDLATITGGFAAMA